MGSYLATPNTEKKSENFENSFLKVGASAMQGWRINQEVSSVTVGTFSGILAAPKWPYSALST